MVALKKSVFLGRVGFDIHGNLIRSFLDYIYEHSPFFRRVAHRLSDYALFVIISTLCSSKNGDVVEKAMWYKENGMEVLFVTNVKSKHFALLEFLLKLKGLDFYDGLVMRPDHVRGKLFKSQVVKDMNILVFFDNDIEIYRHIKENCPACRVVKITNGWYVGN